MAKVISAAEAAALIGDGMTVAVDGFIGFSLAEDILCEMEERFLREGHPRDLRLVNVAGLGGDGRRLENMIYLLLGIGGEGLLRRPHLGQGFLEGFYAVHKGIVRGHGFSLLLSCGYSLGVCVIFLPSGRPHPGLTKV